MTFNNAGYHVEQARDGQKLGKNSATVFPDIVFCDIEMPRMDGLELLSRMQKEPKLSHAHCYADFKGADRHRQMAVQLGQRIHYQTLSGRSPARCRPTDAKVRYW